MHQEHDKGFKDLLSNNKVFVELLSSFISEAWTSHISPEALELVCSSFIIPTFEKREADIIYKLKKGDSTGLEVYFYCLLELQSTVDYSMPIRLLIYMVSLWMEVLKNKPDQEINRKDFRLPVIIPVVLYNGKEPWTAAKEFCQVYGDGIGIAKEYGVNFKYYLVDVNRYEGEELLGKENLIGAIFFIDQRGGKGGRSIEELAEKVHKVRPVLSKLSKQEGTLFLRWMEGIVLEGVPWGTKMEQVLAELRRGEEDKMFVSNFAIEFAEAMEEFKEIIAERDGIKEQMRVMEEERARTEHALRQSVRVMKGAGIPLETIARTTGLSPADLARL